MISLAIYGIVLEKWYLEEFGGSGWISDGRVLFGTVFSA